MTSNNLPALRQKDVVDSAQLDIDLETEVGEGLWSGLLHVLHLHTLGGHAQHRVAHTLDFGCRDRGQRSFREQKD